MGRSPLVVWMAALLLAGWTDSFSVVPTSIIKSCNYKRELISFVVRSRVGSEEFEQLSVPAHK